METKNFNTAVGCISAVATEGAAIIAAAKPIKAKKGCPFTSITKVTVFVNAVIGSDYKEKVEEAQQASGNEPGYELSKVWHKRHDKWFNEHKTTGDLYLRIVDPMEDSNDTSVLSAWIADGTRVEYDAVEPWLYASDKRKPRQDNEKQLQNGVDADKQVDYMLIKADNIVLAAQDSWLWGDDAAPDDVMAVVGGLLLAKAADETDDLVDSIVTLIAPCLGLDAADSAPEELEPVCGDSAGETCDAAGDAEPVCDGGAELAGRDEPSLWTTISEGAVYAAGVAWPYAMPAPEPDPTPEPEPYPTPDPTPEPEPYPTPDPTAEPDPTPDPTPEPEPAAADPMHDIAAAVAHMTSVLNHALATGDTQKALRVNCIITSMLTI